MLWPMFELLAAAHTPFDERGALNLPVVERQAAHLRANGVDGVLVAGSTGEGASLTGAERRALAERWCAMGGGLRVIVQVGHASPMEARSLARHAADAADVGADAICAAPPSWFPIGSADSLARTCEAIADGAPELPFLYYHIPALSGVHVSMARLIGLARESIPSFAGVKFTHTDALDFQACMREHGDAVKLYWGCDEALVTGLALGAHGAIGSTYNFAAPLFHRLIAAHGAGETETVRILQSRAAALVELLAERGYAAAAKRVMTFLGIDCGGVRLPLAELEGAEGDLRAALDGLGFFDWLAETGSA